MLQADIQIQVQQMELPQFDLLTPEVMALHFHRQQTARARIAADRHRFKMISGEQVSVLAAMAQVEVPVVDMALELQELVHHIHRILRDMVQRQVQTINLHRHIPVDQRLVHMTIGQFLNQF